jgi:hypothetical protein
MYSLILVFGALGLNNLVVERYTENHAFAASCLILAIHQIGTTFIPSVAYSLNDIYSIQ